MAAVLASAAPAAAPSESAGSFIRRILSEEITGRWAQQWSELHPGHRALISRADYVSCSRSMGTNIATGGEKLTVRSTRDQAIHVRGVPQRVAKLVTIELRQPGSSHGITYHLHAVAVGDHWAWILGGRFLAQVARGRCLDGSPLGSS